MPDLKVNVAFIGTGLMGLPMVKNLSKGDYSISAFNRTLSKMDELKSIKNINICSSLDEALKDAKVIITSLPDDSAVEKIINEIVNKNLLSEKSIFIDTSSTKYESAKNFYTILKGQKIGIQNIVDEDGNTIILLHKENDNNIEIIEHFKNKAYRRMVDYQELLKRF